MVRHKHVSTYCHSLFPNIDFIQRQSLDSLEDHRIAAVAFLKYFLKTVPIIIIKKNVSFFYSTIVDMIVLSYGKIYFSFHA